jgi:transposase
LLPENVHLRLVQIHVEETVTVTLRSEVLSAVCPVCGQESLRIHSRYQRKPKDLPMSGRPVRLNIEVLRFFYENADCSHTTFAEQLPLLLRPHAQGTVCFQTMLQQLGLALGGKAGARLSRHLGLPISPDSLLRLIRQVEKPAEQSAKIFGMDDWAYRRGLRYSTLICDLETRKPLDLLPDRSVQTVCTWLEQHPEVEVISCDRWSEYATAAQKGAPQALQVADCWHLLSNLVEALTHLLARNRRLVSMVALEAEDRQSLAEVERGAIIETLDAAAVSASLAGRQAQYAHMEALSQQGLHPAQIASRVGLSERTVSRWLVGGAAPHRRHHSRGRSVIDPYKAYVLMRWHEGVRKGSQLCQELKTLGYRGSERAVYRYLTFLHATLLPTEQTTTNMTLMQEPFSAKQAGWLLIRQPEELEAHQQHELARICRASRDIQKAYHLAQRFRSVVRHLQGEQLLDGWLQDARGSGVPELQYFALGIQRDKAAVQAGLSLPYSTGPRRQGTSIGSN